MDQHLYIVSYDIRDPKRWRAVFTLMKGYGEWLQLSVFQCRLTRRHQAELVATLDQIIHHEDDHGAEGAGHSMTLAAWPRAVR